MIFGLFRASANRALIDRLYGELVAAARQPAFYRDYGAPDTFEGRFELLALHGALVVRRLNQTPAPGPDIAQDLSDGTFRNLDADIRESGVGDVAVPKRMKTMAQAFLGRAKAYDAALAPHDDAALATALARNVYNSAREADDADVARLTRYVRTVERDLARLDAPALLRGIPFPDAAAIEAIS